MENLDSTLDLMIDKILEHDEIAFLDLIQLVWRRGWELESATDRHPASPLLHALRACLVERMVEIWNAPPKNANEKVPSWCGEVPALQERFSVIKPADQSFWKKEPSNQIFEKRNIFAPKEFMFFL
ncbi:hypothetical protein [Microbulbifer variabilis]|uniref:hypothetical protein n=1 Tax=Microbulbifer variabilis TaxID=266805 RepID=UPI001CFEE7CC|nr:hypothetical protein [Microbulbifer variabilis]